MRNSPYKFFQRYKAWCYLLPALLILGVFQIYPIIKSFFMGFYTEFDYINGIVYQWGTDNFIKVLEDPDFLLAIKNTCKLVIFAAPLSIGISLLFAVLLNSNILLRKFFQSIYFLPFVTSMVAVSIVWAWMLNKDFGLVNAVLKVFGISKVAWLTDPKMTLPILVVLSIWKGLGYRVIIFLAGLQNIDQRYYLAARMDGAKSIKRFWHVTLPQLRPTIFFLSVTTIIDVFKTFDEVYIMYGNEAVTIKEWIDDCILYFYKILSTLGIFISSGSRFYLILNYFVYYISTICDCEGLPFM